MKAALEVLRPGLCTTVQDLGRPGFQRYGVPPSGPMDEWGLRVANALVGNAPADAVLEVTAIGPVLRVRGEVVLAVAGAEFALDLDGQPVPPFAAFRARDGQILSFGECRSGVRAYLSAAGGIDVPLVMRSRATCLSGRYGGLEGRPLREGDMLPLLGRAAASGRPFEGRFLPRRLWPRRSSPLEVRVVMGPQDDLFAPEGIATFLGSEYRVTNNADRMGYRLDGPPIAHRKGADILSDATAPGAVQVPGDGRPIVLMGDRQTTGGYTKIASVIRPDISALAQAHPGEPVRFRRVSLAEAHAALAGFLAGLRDAEAAVAAPPARSTLHIALDGERRAVEVEETAGGFLVDVGGREFEVLFATPAEVGAGPATIRSPVPGVVAQVHVAPGAAVAPGTRLVTLLAMKLQHDVTAGVPGLVATVHVGPGREVQAGEALLEIEPA
ncbi:MAG TPA: 5-oxoprolinase/urea amidolyase family protein [Candidatus Methylomirabilis sp.]